MNATASASRRQSDAPALQRSCGCGGSCGKCGGGDEGRVLRRQSSGATHLAPAVAPPIVHDVLRAPGAPLDRETRTAMETHFNHDFSQVRVHHDASAWNSAEAVGAHAYTVGRDVVFGAGKYAPQSRGGSQLLAHELAHVVQQRNAVSRSAASIEIGDVHDALERDADASASGQVPVPRVQRSFLGTLRDILLFVPRLFGAGGYPDSELADYLKGLKKTHSIENGIFSDNKARGCVDADDEKRLTALGAPYDLEIKQLLVEEMVKGFTSFLDEGAIIRLLRRQSDDVRQKIVDAVTRPRLWSNFSGGNRRIIEGLTLTAADAQGANGDALVGRLRGLSSDELNDYRVNVKDPALQQVVQRAAMLHSITAPVPNSAVLAAPPPAPKLKGGPLPAQSAKATISGVDVYALPDVFDASLGKQAFTDEVLGGKLPGVLTSHPDAVSGEAVVDDFSAAAITIHIRTRYGDPTAPSKRPVYGVGTRPGDAQELQTHERSHGADWFYFIRTTPPPVFQGHNGMTVTEFNAELAKYEPLVDAWFNDASMYSFKHTDCVGTLPTDADLVNTPYKAAMCHAK